MMEDAERPDPIKIRKQVTEVMVFTFDWRETGATNQERLLTAIAKAAVFVLDVRHDIKATIILANIDVAAQYISKRVEAREAQRKIKAKYKYNHSHDNTFMSL